MFKNYLVKVKVNKEIEIYAPLTGEYINIENIPDPVFAQNDGRRLWY